MLIGKEKTVYSRTVKERGVYVPVVPKGLNPLLEGMRASFNVNADNYLLFYLYIYPPGLQESDEGAIHKAGRPASGDAKILLSASNLLAFCQDHQAGESAVKCLSQAHNRIEPRPCKSSVRCFNHSTTLPTQYPRENWSKP